MQYYSRKSGESKELLEEHLIKTSCLCEEYMSKFGMPVTGRVIGRLHDIGKHTKKFQEVLFNGRTKVNHAIVGGMELYSIFQYLWSDIAYISSSHHHGLENDWEFYPDFSKQNSLIDMDNKENALNNWKEFEEIQDWLDEIGLNISQEEVNAMCKEFQTIKSKSENERMLINRMIFSCLVDADYSASASFENPEYCDTAEGEKLNPDFLLDNLQKYRKSLIKDSMSDSQLNQLRNEIYDACVNAGKKSNKNYTLTAPTGTGKTLAMLAFALEQAKTNNKDRIIFVLPYLSIIEQNAQIYKDICGEDMVLEADSQADLDERARVLSERWSSPIIITTSVSFFETLFRYKGTNLRKLHNICNSVVVFDEAQTLPFDILDSSLEAINVLNSKFNVTTLFSTATQPSFNYREKIKNNCFWSPVEIISNPQTLYERYEKIKNLTVNWLVDKTMSYEGLWNLVKAKESFLVIFNLRRHAREFYNMIKANNTQNDSLYYITTDLCIAHRKNLIQKINTKIKNGKPVKVISTQCLEAGVDLDFQYVYRAFGPATSIIQAAGRTSRNATSAGELTVFIPQGERIYPDNIYKKSAQQLNTILKTSGSFDINSLDDIDKYYHYLFTTNEIDADSRELLANIKKLSYEGVSDNYKLIKNSGVTIIVPYNKEDDLYDDIRDELDCQNNHIDKRIMKKARKITVSSYNKECVEQFCEKLYFNIAGEDVPSGWYILSKEMNMYHDDIGLSLKEDDTVFLF